ncbi:MAG: alkaline phosphatase family protein [Alphaproteobacteria bacterium]
MTRRRNVLLVTVDQWRGDFLPWARTPFLKVPAISALAAEAMVFNRHYTVTTPCGPARASLLTGLYAMNHRAVQNTVPLDARHTNLAKEVRRRGYDPVIVGYTTTTPDPRTTGPDDPRFKILGDVMDGFRPLANLDPYPAMHEYFRWVAGKGFAPPADPHDIWLPADGPPGPTAAPARIPAELWDTAWMTDAALGYLASVGSAPWFLHLCYWRPHQPFVAPEPWNTAYAAADMPAPVRTADPAAEAARHPLLRFYVENTKAGGYFHRAEGPASAIDEAGVRQARATYCGLMSEVDAQLGRVLDFLKASGQWDDTLVVLTSDHGEMLGDHWLFGKAGWFDPVFRVPLVMRLPGHAGRCDAFTESVDILPTVLDWIGAPAPRACDGRTLLPLCRGDTPADWRTEAHFEFDFRDLWHVRPESALGVRMDAACLAGVRGRRFKYVHFPTLPPLLFDLAEDPFETVDLSGDAAALPHLLDGARRMLNWRLEHAERTLTGYRATPTGLETRA